MAGILNSPTPQPPQIRRPLTLLHTSDLHLGHPAQGQKALAALESVLSSADRYAVDALIIAGDLFDTSRVTQEEANRVFGALGSLGRPVIVLPGNHDVLLTSPSTSFSYERLPAQVHVLKAAGGESLSLETLGLSVWGRAVRNHGPAFRPLQGLPARPSNQWYVAVAHGLVVDSNANGWSLPISMEDLARADCDYIALGHMDEFEDVTQGPARACYSGAPWGTRDPAVALVTLDKLRGVQVEAMPLL